MSPKIVFISLALLTLFVIVTSLFSNSSGKGLTKEEEALHHKQLTDHGIIHTRKPASPPEALPPLPIKQSSTQLPTQKQEDWNSNNNNNNDDDEIILPAVPFSSQRARLATFRKVQQQQTKSSQRIQNFINEHEKYCTEKVSPDPSLRAQHFNQKLKDRLEKAGSTSQYFRAAKSNFPVSNIKSTDLFSFVVFNFGDEMEGANTGSVGGFAGHQRVLIHLVWKNTHERVCVDGAVIEASLLSFDREYIDVDFFIDILPGFGLYEVQPFIRRAGSNYTLCLSLNAINAAQKWKISLKKKADEINREADESVDDDWWAVASDNQIAQYFDYIGYSNGAFADVPGNPDFCVRQSHTNRQCFTATKKWSFDSINKASLKKVQQTLNEQRVGGGFCSAGSSSFSFSGNGFWVKIDPKTPSCFTDEFGEFIINSPSSSPSSLQQYQICKGDPRSAYPKEFVEKSKPEDFTPPLDEFDMFSHADKWVFISDTCQLSFFTREEQWSIVDKNWMMWWGASTAKQPIANFIEYNLGTWIFGAPMEHLEFIRKARKRPSFFTYRAFDVVKERRPEIQDNINNNNNNNKPRRMRSTLCWGGCPNPAAAPNCGDYQGIANRREQDRKLSCVGRAFQSATLQASSSSSATDDSVPPFPSVLILTHSIWRYPLYNITSFIDQVDDTMKWLETTMCTLVRANNNNSQSSRSFSPPTLIWLGAVRRMYEDEESSHCWSDDTRAFNRMLDWKHQEYFERYIKLFNEKKRGYCSANDEHNQKGTLAAFKNVHYVARHELTSPLHSSGGKFGHFGVHYGATKGMCLTGMNRNEKYSLQKCVRNTAADWMLLQWLMNLMS